MTTNSSFQNDDVNLLDSSPNENPSQNQKIEDTKHDDQQRSFQIKEETFHSLLFSSFSKLSKITSPNSTSTMTDVDDSKKVKNKTYGLLLAFISGVLMTVYSSMIKILGRF